MSPRYQKIANAIVDHLILSRAEGAQCVYFDALTGRDGSVDWETLGDLVDSLRKTTRVRVRFEGGRPVSAEEIQ